MTLCILGRQPAIGLAELEVRFGAAAVTPIERTAALVESDIDLRDFGGTVKTAAVLATVSSANFDRLIREAAGLLRGVAADMPEGKIKLGLSFYGIGAPEPRINAAGLTLKKILKGLGRSVRVVPNKSPALTSAQVLHNQLLSEVGIELVFVRHADTTIIARALQEQDIEDYALRDRGRPRRDAFVGMLPPKLAQIMINLGTGASAAPPQASRATPEHGEAEDSTKEVAMRGVQPPRILDPFCGTGVLLQEVALRGFAVYGTDIEERMIRYSRDNINWLKDAYGISFNWYLEVGDATEHRWQPPVDAVICETYLGQPLSGLPKPEKLQEIIHTCNVIHRKFLQNIGSQIPAGTPLCLAVPAWRVGNGFRHLPVLRDIEEIGYTRRSLVHADRSELIYHREDQIVARELLILAKKS